MKKEIFEKLNQQDRIEYLLLKDKDDEPNGIFNLVLLILVTVSLLTNLSTALFLLDGDKEELKEELEGINKLMGFSIILLIITIVISFGVSYYITTKLDKKYLAKLDIKAKKESGKDSKETI